MFWNQFRTGLNEHCRDLVEKLQEWVVNADSLDVDRSSAESQRGATVNVHRNNANGVDWFSCEKHQQEETTGEANRRTTV